MTFMLHFNRPKEGSKNNKFSFLSMLTLKF